MWGKVKIDAADTAFSRYIRLRDGKCVAPGCPMRGGGPEGIHGLDASHFWSRRNESTRYDEKNVDALCRRHHQLWGGDYREAYIAFKKKQLGEEGYKRLMVRAHSIQKKDRKMSLIIARALLKDLLERRKLSP